MDTYFKALGDSILKLWKQENFSLEKFPPIATAVLKRQPPATQVDLRSLMRDFLLNEELPSQTDSPFGEPEIVVYNHARFYIQLLFWMDGTTAIHQHAFSGAFHVMLGSSIHAHYHFEKARPITPYMSVGNVKMTEIEILETGRTVPIASGKETIHSLFHLDSPSITVVVRTQHDPGTGPQFNYLPPHMAIDPTHSDLLTMRRSQLLDVLEATQDPGYSAQVMEMLADLDFERGFYVLQHCMASLEQLDQWDPAIKLFKKKHGNLAAGVAATLTEQVRRNALKSFRGSIIDPEHRFFLALLMNAPTRTDLFELVAQRFGKQPPLEILLRWAEELIEESDEGVFLLDANFPRTVEVDQDRQAPVFLAALKTFLNGGKKASVELSDLNSTDITALRTAFAKSSLGLLLNS